MVIWYVERKKLPDNDCLSCPCFWHGKGIVEREFSNHCAGTADGMDYCKWLRPVSKAGL